MREIIFRGQRLDNSQWVYGYFRHYENNQHTTEKWTIYEPSLSLEHEVDPDTVGQYTGCIDVDGDKIYEGDILTATIFDHNGDDTMHTVIVEWDEEYAQYVCLDVNDKDCMWDLGWIILNDGEPLIVGNRWDNASLMKGGGQ